MTAGIAEILNGYSLKAVLRRVPGEKHTIAAADTHDDSYLGNTHSHKHTYFQRCTDAHTQVYRQASPKTHCRTHTQSLSHTHIHTVRATL